MPPALHPTQLSSAALTCTQAHSQQQTSTLGGQSADLLPGFHTPTVLPVTCSSSALRSGRSCHMNLQELRSEGIGAQKCTDKSDL